MNIICIDNFQQLEELICRELCWYTVYEAALDTAELFHMDYSEASSSSRFDVYRYVVESKISKTLSLHVFNGAQVKLMDGVLEDAMTYLAMKVPEASTFELGGYLNYLEAWSRETEDWKGKAPAPFDYLEFELVR